VRHVVGLNSRSAYVLDAFRAYLVVHLSGARCSDEIGDALIDDVNHTLNTYGLPRCWPASGRRPPVVAPARQPTVATRRQHLAIQAGGNLRRTRRPGDPQMIRGRG
jgi:hypothetical protein